MAQQQAYQAYAQNKGTLVPGLVISINQHTVQVERYLSQGGFAHVYLVRTQAEVYGTTSHVLKRIAVPNDAMLTEVKKEVDFMRILRGHPNIVNLIDASWHRLPTGMYEVFILMEYCRGGGIIDMMNRRLRERLSEAEILLIFVDVCEGVAAMHNLRPPILHRDLKVENILQASETSYKLCDFGSACPVAPRPPATTQEIRALEADLNRHTTLQYRAPEMVDPYLRRPVDEKSDVWALGVLLYKLCYYTTPFEEHGPLAILNVQYRIPSYPVYSPQMNGLIASMLKEHGTQRPHVFEILTTVHALRGSKSRYVYKLPTPPPLSSRHNFSSPQSNPLEGLVSFTSPATQLPSAPKNAGVQLQARNEAITPMRRGRPSSSIFTRSEETTLSTVPPNNPRDEGRNEKLQSGLKPPGNLAVRGHKSGVVSSHADTWKPKNPSLVGSSDDAWGLAAGASNGKTGGSSGKLAVPSPGFGDDFTSQKFWDTSSSSSATPQSSSRRQSPQIVVRSSPPKVAEPPHGVTSNPPNAKARDAFEGLGLTLSNKTPPPTLGEARKLRTGLAATSESRQYTSSTSRPPSSSARPTPSPATGASASSMRPQATRAFQTSSENLTPEARYPTLEELDATFATPFEVSQAPPKTHALSQPSPSGIPLPSGNTGGGLRPLQKASPSHGGVRSQQVTGYAMRESLRSGSDKPLVDTSSINNMRQSLPPRPLLSRKHRSSVTMKHAAHPSVDLLGDASPASPLPGAAPKSDAAPRFPREDWLSSAGDELPARVSSPSTTQMPSDYHPVLRGSPGKRAAFTERSLFPIPAPQEAATQQTYPKRTSSPSPFTLIDSLTTATPTSLTSSNDSPERKRSSDKKFVNRRTASTSRPKPGGLESSSSADEGPEDAKGYVPPTATLADNKKRRGKARQSSVHDLVDLWGGGLKDGEKQTPRSRESKIATLEPGLKTSPGKRPPISPLLFPSANASSSLLKESSETELSPVSNRSPKRSHHRKSSKAGSTGIPQTQTRASGHQSMFLVPSNPAADKASDAAATSSPAAHVRAEAKPRTRRTSISDMVQHYEAIGSKAKVGVAPSVAPKPANLKLATSPTAASSNENGRHQRGPSSPIIPKANVRTSTSIPVPPSSDVVSGPVGKWRTSPTGQPVTTRPKEPESDNNVNPRGFPYRPSAADDSTTVETKHLPPSPTRKQSVEDPSPDKPYQGVGKLIDQWQRKTAEADSPKPPAPRRGGFVARAGDRY